MLKQMLTILVACSLLTSAAAPLASAQTPKEDAKRAARWKRAIETLGTGKDSRVAVRLRDKSELKGYVSEKDDESFVVVDAETGATTRVLYAKVEKVEITSDVLKGVVKKKSSLKQLQKGIAIGMGIFAAVGFIVYIAGGRRD
jgi:hypothetical protein